jgi:hypothetical protein
MILNSDAFYQWISVDFTSPSNRTVTAFNQMVKGCELAMNSALLLAQENQDLRAAIEQESLKRKRSNKKIVHKGSLTVEEAQNLIQAREVANSATTTAATTAPEDPPVESAIPASQPAVRAPPKCSNCGIVGHKRNKCPILTGWWPVSPGNTLMFPTSYVTN